MSSFIFFPCKATDSLQTLFFFFFWSSEKKKSATQKEWNHGNVGGGGWGLKKRQKKRTNASIWEKKVQHFTEWRFYCATFRTLGSNSVVLFCLTFSVSVLMLIFMDYLKPVCFMLIIYIFPLYKKKRKEKRHNCSLSCTHTIKWILSQEGQGSRVPTPRHFNVHFYDELKKKKKNEKKEKKGWFKRNNSKHWKLWISEEEKIPFVSKSVAVT